MEKADRIKQKKAWLGLARLGCFALIRFARMLALVVLNCSSLATFACKKKDN